MRKHVGRLGWLLAASVALMLARIALNPGLLKTVPAEVNRVSIETFKDWEKSGRTLTLIDARDRLFYLDGHIPGAKNLPRRGLQSGAVAGKISSLADKEQLVVLYCSGRECTDSSWLAEELSRLGYRQVWVLDGGWEDWLAGGGEVAK
jgi:rhodanese-related sulfurtransferase